MENPNSLEQCY